MKIDWKKFAHVGVKIVGAVVPAVGVVEGVAEKFLNMGSKDKQASVVETVQSSLIQELGKLGPRLLFNPRVVAAINAVIDAIVYLHQVIAQEAAALDSEP